MEKLAVVTASLLAASCLSTGQVQAPDATVQAGPPVASERSQTDNGAGEIPTFYSHARQVLVTASVWKHVARSVAWVPKETLKRYPTAAEVYASPPVARGLSANDFRIFDNGAEQKINYLEESDFSGRDANEQWFFSPESGELGVGLFQLIWHLQRQLRPISSDILPRSCNRATVTPFE